MIELAKPSLCFEVSHPEYGKQDKGVNPKGASDRLSFEAAFTLLGKPEEFICYELLACSKVVFVEDGMFCFTGAHYEKMVLTCEANEVEIEHAKVYEVKKGSTLTLHAKNRGFRSYIMGCALDKMSIVKQLPSYEAFFTPHAKIRVMAGVEFSYLEDAEAVLSKPYTISNDSSLMGLRLVGEKIEASRYDIISNVVADGTVQLTKEGLIVLMRHRQSTGGYPRVLQVLACDLDRLAQYRVGDVVQFELVSQEEAIALLEVYEKQKKDYLDEVK